MSFCERPISPKNRGGSVLKAVVPGNADWNSSALVMYLTSALPSRNGFDDAIQRVFQKSEGIAETMAGPSTSNFYE